MKYSYSSIATYKQCPAKFEFAYITKPDVPGIPPGPALERGTTIHNSVEDYLNGSVEFLHPDIHSNYGQFMLGIREGPGDIRPEWEWGITWEFKPCAYDAADCMLHGYMDLVILPEDTNASIDLYEWKTGKIYREPHNDQINKYSIALMSHFPEYPGVDAMLTYFDQHDYKKVAYPQTMMFEYKPALRREIGTIADATRFPTMPSFKCKWCKFSRHNGGPCQF